MTRRTLKVVLGIGTVVGVVAIGSRAQLARAQGQDALVFTVPKSYGVLKAVGAGDGGPVFEASDGTIRYMSLRENGLTLLLTIRRQ